MPSYTFSERESKLIEFKSKVPTFSALIKTCVAFANASGGRIIIGVDDVTHEALGISNEDRIKIYDDFPNSLYDSTSPSLIAQIYEQNFGEDSVLIIEIPVSPRKPYFLKSKGISDGTYIRVGSSTRKAKQEHIEDLVRESQRINFDEENVHASIDVLSTDLLKEFYTSKYTPRRLVADKIIASNHANKDQDSPTVAGVLMFSQSPDTFIPEAMIKCTIFKGNSGREILRSEDITGSIEEQANKCIKIIKIWLTTDFYLRGAKLVGKLPIPQNALREAILNALFHRKYNIPGAIKVAIYDDRLEIFSPGCFPGLVDINNLGDGTTYLRNPTLVRLAYQFGGLIETRGRGIRLIFESCKKARVRKPEFHEEGDFVKVVFYFEPDLYQYNNDEDAIMALFDQHTEVTAQQVADYLAVSRNSALRKLNNLLDKKLIQKLGQGPSVVYILFQR